MTAATATVTATSATVKGDALRDALKAALSFADPGVYQCAGVMISVKGGNVILAATDRYRLVEITIPAVSAYGNMEEMARVSYGDIKSLIATLTAAKIKGYSAELTVLRETLTVKVLGNSQEMALDGKPIPYVHLFPLFIGDFEEGVRTPHVSLNPAYLADFAKVAGKGNPITLRFSGDGKVISVESVANKSNSGYTWRGLLMPVSVRN